MNEKDRFDEILERYFANTGETSEYVIYGFWGGGPTPPVDPLDWMPYEEDIFYWLQVEAGTRSKADVCEKFGITEAQFDAARARILDW